MNHIHLTTGEKGGVGKSIFSLNLLAYLEFIDKLYFVAECDRSNGDVGAAYQGKKTVIQGRFTDNPNQISKADILIEGVLEHQSDAVVNLPAQSFESLATWLKTGSLDAATDNQIRFFVWFITSGEKDSIGLLYKSLEEFGSIIPHVLVRNIYIAENLKYDYSDPERNDALAEILSKSLVPVINLPRYITTDLNIIRTHELTLTEAIESPLLGVVSRSRLRRSLHEFFAQLNTLEVFNNGVSKRSGSRKKN
jgi:hypothetical protein